MPMDTDAATAVTWPTLAYPAVVLVSVTPSGSPLASTIRSRPATTRWVLPPEMTALMVLAMVLLTTEAETEIAPRATDKEALMASARVTLA